MNLAPPIPRFGRPTADPEARERELAKESRRSANRSPAKDLTQALQRERHAPDYTILVVVVALACLGVGHRSTETRDRRGEVHGRLRARAATRSATASLKARPRAA